MLMLALGAAAPLAAAAAAAAAAPATVRWNPTAPLHPSTGVSRELFSYTSDFHVQRTLSCAQL
jgi:hypothetical protein